MTRPSEPKTHPDSAASWGQAAAHLLEFEKKMSWGQTHPSFSRWLADFAKNTKRGEATLWRALAAGRYYNELRTEFAERGIAIPTLNSSDVAASPESLELVDKLSRVAPAELVQSLQQKVLEGKISRRELRTYWETYRPVLQGLTARGRNVAAPRFNPRNIEMISSRLEADCIAGLVKDGPAWLGSPRADVYKVIHMSAPRDARMFERTTPDVIVVFKANRSSPLEIHGIEATVRLDANPLLRHYRRQGLGVDHLWAAIPTETDASAAIAPREVGLIEASSTGVRVIRKAGLAKQNGTEIVTTLKEILAREVGA